ncbi:importin beta-1 SU (nucleomorph) [Chroomonas mesostigmatica CCMP1168]|uniref:Importin beta-1 SU n=1 Tax=Chroomonas mesostigmatica CCMP1168 TaxID=1195612 RepID=J7GAM0_9CRYP|nr:importin beta-1 SU [Chroomonas mesostigmatica CCMP1168]
MIPSELILSIQHPNSKIRKNAEIALNRIEKMNKYMFLFELSDILANENSKSEIRTMSGILIKNKIGFFSQKKKKNIKKWFQTVKNLKKKGIEKNLFKSFSSFSENARKISAQIVARIIQIELLGCKESGMIVSLKKLLKSSNFEKTIFHSVLKSIQYLYQDVESEKISVNLFKNISVDILRIVLYAINQTSEELSQLKIEGLNALNDGIRIIGDILNNTDYKEFIFNSVINQIHVSTEVVRKLIFEFFDKTINDYYFCLEKYIPLLFEMTIFTLRCQEEHASPHAIEFWSSISEKEYEISINNYQAAHEGRSSTEYSFFLTEKAGDHLPILLYSIIMEKKENFESDEWNFRTAAGSCLNLISQTIPLLVIKQIFPFLVSDMKTYHNSLEEEGKMLTFGAIFDGLGSKILYQTVHQILHTLILNLENSDFKIRNVTSWLIGKIESFTPYSLREIITRLVRLLFKNVIDDQIIDFAYYSLNRILISFGKEGILDWCYEGIFFIISKSIWINFDQKKKVHEFLEMLCLVTMASSIRQKAYVYSVIPFVFSKFKELIYCSGNISPFELQTIQIHLCRFLNITIQKLCQKINSVFIQQFLEFLSFLSSAGKSSEAEWFIEEETIICIGIITNMCEKKFFFLLKRWFPFLLNGAVNIEDFQISSLSITILGDLLRIFSKETVPFVPKIIDIISGIFKNSRIKWNIKSPIIEFLGDILVSKYSYWFDFMKFITPFFCSTAFLAKDPLVSDDIDFFDNNLQIKESLGDSMTSILSNYCFHEYEKKNLINIFGWVDNFLYKIILENRNERLITICIGLIGDLNKNILAFKSIFLNQKWVHQLMFEGKHTKEEKIETLLTWTRSSFVN